MFKDKPYGLYRYGYVEDLETLTPQNLYEYYIDLIIRGKIDIFVSGEIEKGSIENLVKENEEIVLGQPLMKVDLDYIKANAESTITPIVVTNLNNKTLDVVEYGKINRGDKAVLIK